MSEMDHEPPELLAPAGNWECVKAAVANGADAIYFGLPRFNARMRADNFSESDLPEVVAYVHRYGVKAYVAFNTLVFTGELEAASEALRALSRAGVDALIVQDVGVVRLARRIVPDLPIHASTQMTITSPEGVAFARELGVERVVLARELSLRDLEKFGARESGAMPLEVFVHGALCVAYSGQCLTSESLGQRSANRGECAQACRMPYELWVDGQRRDLGDRRYLLSPQDLAAVEEIPRLLELGVRSFKIEGRLKSPEYVAAVCQVYRKALDAALEGRFQGASEEDRYQLEMTFSRGLFSGWMHGVDHQRLVPARFGKKRGPFVGRITRVGPDYVEIRAEVAVSPGDGVVFDTGGDTNAEQGGHVFEVRGNRYFFQRGHVDFSRLREGHRVWKTQDPSLQKRLRQSYRGATKARRPWRVDVSVRGTVGGSLRWEARLAELGVEVSVESEEVLEGALRAPLTEERLREHLGRFGEVPFVLGRFDVALEGAVILPIAALNRLRRRGVAALEGALRRERREEALAWQALVVAPREGAVLGDRPSVAEAEEACPSLSVLCRSEEHVQAALECGVRRVLLDFEDVRRYRDAVRRFRQSVAEMAHGVDGAGRPEVWLATPRIQKAGEQGFFKLIENAEPDGVLIRNLGGLEYFGRSGVALRRMGDFSLNVANPLTAREFLSRGLERVTLSYDLSAEQVLECVAALPVGERGALEVTLHQHMPMFHMEHCVFAAFLSKGSSFLDCGRPCEKHRVHVRDRVGVSHPLRADVGCRNTLFNAKPQTGAQYFEAFQAAGLRSFRVELLEEDASESVRVLRAYEGLMRGEREGRSLWKELNALSQLGVTSGTLEARSGGRD
jgi:putative protease